MHLASSLSKGARAQRGRRPVELTDVQRPHALLATPQKRSGSVWPARIEPVAPRVSGGRSTRLTSGHVMGEAGVEPAASCARTDLVQMTRSALAERCFTSHSPTLRPWIAGNRRPTWRGFGARVSNACGKRARKSSQRYFLRHFQRQAPSDLSLSGGASVRSMSSSS